MRSILQTYFPFLMQLVVGVVIFVVGWILARGFSRLMFRALERRDVDVGPRRFLARIVHYALLFATVIAALGTVGVRTTSLIALLGSAGLAVGLALQGNLSNFASGIVLMVARPYAIGEVVTVCGQSGRVDDVGLFATTIITANREKVIIPNAKVANDVITNLTVLEVRRGTIEIGIPYDADVAQAEAVLLAAIAGVEGVLEEPPPRCEASALGGGACTLSVGLWSNAEDLSATLARGRRALLDAVTSAGIAIK